MFHCGIHPSTPGRAGTNSPPAVMLRCSENRRPPLRVRPIRPYLDRRPLNQLTYYVESLASMRYRVLNANARIRIRTCNANSQKCAIALPPE